MTAQSSIHFYLNWTKERIDEMDAAVAALEAKASQIQASSKQATDRLIADLKKRRDEFHAGVKEYADAGEAALQANKAQLESQWRGFEAQIKSYFETVGQELEQQQTAFEDMAAAQIKGWRQAADKLHEDGAKVAAARRAGIDDTVKQMKAQAAEVEDRLQKLKQAGGESWVILSAALAESREAFDQAIQQASDAFKRASSPKT